MLSILAERDFPVADIHAVASSRSAGTKIEFNGEAVVVEDLEAFDFSGIDIGLFSRGLRLGYLCTEGGRRRLCGNRQYFPF